MTQESSTKIKRSTARLRKFYRNKKLCRKLLVSCIVSNHTDLRYYAKVKFLDFEELGLLDTGASISCIGSELALIFLNLNVIRNANQTLEQQMANYNKFLAGWMLKFFLETSVRELNYL